MKLNSVFAIAVIVIFCSFINNAAEKAVLVHNSLEEIEACKGKLRLELIRVWGGDKEEDEHKFFTYPISVTVDKKNDLVYICDQTEHCVKVFKSSGEYVRTIGQRGKGPGDIYCPHTVSLTPGGDIVVYELGSYRIQRFSPEGKSMQIIKVKTPAFAWVDGVTSKDELLFYNTEETYQSRKLVSILDRKGNIIRKIGTYHDKSPDKLSAEILYFTIDGEDNIYAINTHAPVIRKYSIGGQLLMAVTFELPFETAPVEISLNNTGDEIKIVREEEESEQTRKIKEGDRILLQGKKRKGKPKMGAGAIHVDACQRIYIVTSRRLLMEKERRATRIGWSFDSINRDKVDFDIVERMDAYRLLVFDSEGKIIAQAQLTTFCNDIHISDDRIFILDGSLNQRILEYRMVFEDKAGS